MSVFILSFLPFALTLKSTYEFVIVMSFASKSLSLSIPYVLNVQFGAKLGTLIVFISSTFIKPYLHI